MTAAWPPSATFGVMSLLCRLSFVFALPVIATERRNQAMLAALGGGDRRLLDVAEATNLKWQGCQFDGRGVVVRRKPGDDGLDCFFKFLD